LLGGTIGARGKTPNCVRLGKLAHRLNPDRTDWRKTLKLPKTVSGGNKHLKGVHAENVKPFDTGKTLLIKGRKFKQKTEEKLHFIWWRGGATTSRTVEENRFDDIGKENRTLTLPNCAARSSNKLKP